MPVDRRKVAVFGGALALRLLLLLLFPSLPDLLTGRVEVSTPVTSFKRRMFHSESDVNWRQLTYMLQFKKVFSSTTAMCHLMTEASSTR